MCVVASLEPGANNSCDLNYIQDQQENRASKSLLSPLLAGCLHRGEECVFMVGQSLGMDTFIQQQLPGGVYPRWEPGFPGHKHTDIAISVLVSLPPCNVVLPCPHRVLRVKDKTLISTMHQSHQHYCICSQLIISLTVLPSKRVCVLAEELKGKWLGALLVR